MRRVYSTGGQFKDLRALRRSHCMGSPYAARWDRFMAYVADSWVILGAQGLGGTLGSQLAVRFTSAPEAAETGLLFGAIFWGFAAWFMNYGVLQGTLGASFGKLIFRLRVVRSDGAPIGIGRSLARSSCMVISAAPLYLGYLWALFSPQQKTWHDRLCATQVIRKGAHFAVRPQTPPQEQPLPSLAA